MWKNAEVFNVIVKFKNRHKHKRNPLENFKIVIWDLEERFLINKF